ncbi:MAG TPA: GNAT family N-acetyltransferase [Pyrinomonadaceae bacterium]
MLVRKATKDDSQRIAELAMKLVEQHVGYDPVRFSRIATLEGMKWFYEGQTEVENAAVFVAEAGGQMVGFAYMQFEPILYADLATNVAWLHDIFVDSNVRGTGAGKKMIEAVATEARRFGANKVLLSVAAKNAEAQEFFARSGFRTTMHEMMLVVDE